MTPAVPGPLDQWRDDLADRSLVHADAAGCSARSRAVVERVKRHLDLEAEVGGYVAEEQVSGELAAARASLARLVGSEDAHVVFAANATEGWRWLLWSWPLRSGARIGVLPSEYPANRAALDIRADRDGVELVTLPTDGVGHIDLDGFAAALPGLDLVTFPHIPSHRGIVQPAEQVGAMCRAHGTPLVLDVAQSLGQRDLTGIGADAYVGTSRKWLRGPRGVGFVIVATDRIETNGWLGPEAGDGAVAERLGLAVALGRLEHAGVPAVEARILSLTARLRGALVGLEGWEVIEPVDEPSGSTTLRHLTHDPAAVRRDLLEKRIVTAVVPVERAPLELKEPLLRLSLHAYCTEEEIDRIIRTLPP